MMEKVPTWAKNNPTDKIWWKYVPDVEGEYIFSFDCVKEFNMFHDYPWKLSAEEKRIFDAENPRWAAFFRGREREK